MLLENKFKHLAVSIFLVGCIELFGCFILAGINWRLFNDFLIFPSAKILLYSIVLTCGVSALLLKLGTQKKISTLFASLFMLLSFIALIEVYSVSKYITVLYNLQPIVMRECAINNQVGFDDILKGLELSENVVFDFKCRDNGKHIVMSKYIYGFSYLLYSHEDNGFIVTE